MIQYCGITSLLLLSFAISDAFRFTISQTKNLKSHVTIFSDISSVEVLIPLGEGYESMNCRFRPLFGNSTFRVVTYKVPFNLNIEKPPRGFPAPIVTKTGEQGELVGDALRATTCWSQGFNAAGATSDIMMFAGNIRWRKSIFETTGAPWQQVVDALLSNTKERSEYVTLVFERELS